MEDYEWKQTRVVIGLLLITLVCIVMAGCGGTPFVRAGAYQHGGTAANPLGKFEVGLEWEWGECAWAHISQVTEGRPFNHRRDRIKYSALGCSYKIGGR